MTLTIEATTKPDAASSPESDNGAAWHKFRVALSPAALLEFYPICKAIAALGEASHRLDALGLDWGELADLIVELEGALAIANKVENKANILHAREQFDWPKADLGTAA